MTEAETTLRAVIAAFDTGDRAELRAHLSPDLVAYVTNGDGGVDRVNGPDGYMSRVPDVGGADYSVSVTQAVNVSPAQVLAMVEVKANRQNKTLHNHAAFLATVADGKVTELWMVDALPAYSDEFWS